VTWCSDNGCICLVIYPRFFLCGVPWVHVTRSLHERLNSYSRGGTWFIQADVPCVTCAWRGSLRCVRWIPLVYLVQVCRCSLSSCSMSWVGNLGRCGHLVSSQVDLCCVSSLWPCVILVLFLPLLHFFLLCLSLLLHSLFFYKYYIFNDIRTQARSRKNGLNSCNNEGYSHLME
jgi:hypothetical protein